MKTIKILLILLLFVGFSSCKDELPPPVDEITINDPTDDPVEDNSIEDDPEPNAPDTVPIIEWKDTIMNPIQELSWLKEIIAEQESNTTTKVIIRKCIYDSTFGILIDWCVDCPEGPSQFFDYAGIVVCESKGTQSTCPYFQYISIAGKILFETNPVVVIPPPCDNGEIVDAISLNSNLKEELNTVFSKKNPLVQVMLRDVIYVINNEQDFFKICSDPIIASQINFTTQTIVWGVCISPLGRNYIENQQLFECTANASFRYHIHIKEFSEGFTDLGVHYYWGVYPRKINKDNIYLTRTSSL